MIKKWKESFYNWLLRKLLMRNVDKHLEDHEGANSVDTITVTIVTTGTGVYDAWEVKL